MDKYDKIKISVATSGLALIAALTYFLGRKDIITQVTVIIVFVVWLVTMITINRKKKKQKQQQQ